MTAELRRRSPWWRKPVTATVPSDTGLRRSMGTVQLTMIGVGSTVGTGIFFVLAQAVPEAGPAVLVSFVLAAVTAGLAALCYAELASAIPVAGSSYSYAYATLGEVVAFGVAACLLLEYGVSSAAVAVGWSEYVDSLLTDTVGLTVPAVWTTSPADGGIVNLPAVVLVAMCTLLLVRGTRESARTNAVLVIVKLAVLVLFAVIAFTGFRTANLADFAPFGVAGVGAAAGTIFFSFIGLDAVSTAGEEVRDPQRTMPRAIVAALLVVTAVYLLVALAGVAAQPWQAFEGQTAGLAAILREVTGSTWPAVVLAVGAVVSIFGITLVLMYGQTRILMTMSRDGLLPRVFARVDARTSTPVRNTFIVGAVVAVLAGLVPLDYLADLISMGTLIAFSVVAVSVLVLRRTAPHLDRPFRVPGYPVTPVLAVAACLYLIAGLGWITYLAFACWLALAMAYYFGYARRSLRRSGQ